MFKIRNYGMYTRFSRSGSCFVAPPASKADPPIARPSLPPHPRTRAFPIRTSRCCARTCAPSASRSLPRT